MDIRHCALCAIIAILLFNAFETYRNHCKECVQRCVFFSLRNIGTCFDVCRCPNFDRVVSPHLPDHSKYAEDLKMSGGDYDKPIKLEPKNSKLEHKSKPNIVMIILDDADAKISPIMEAMPFAKELFELNGTHFTRAFTSTSYCCPARCQIFTGMYGHNNGVTSMYGKFASIGAFRMPFNSNGTRQMNPSTRKLINNEYRTLNYVLESLGYTTHALGKFINGIENDHTFQIDYVPPGWTTFNVGADHFMYTGYRYSLTNWTKGDNKISYEWYGTKEDDYITDVLSRKAVNIISKSSDAPFFLYVAPTAPHVPMFPAERHRDKLDYWASKYDQYVSSRPNYNADLKNKSYWLRSTEKERDELHNSDLKWNQMDWARRMSSMHSVNDLILNIYNKVKDSGKLNNTIFIFGSDNGYNLYAHKQTQKMSPNLESIAIPLHIVGGGFGAGVVDDQLALLIDIAPTIYDILGYKSPDYVDGYSLKSKVKRSCALIQYKNKNFHDELDNLSNSPELLNVAKVAPKQLLYDVPPFTAIKTVDYILVEYYNSSETRENEYELYDLVKDPYQLENVYHNQEYENIKQNLTFRLKQLEQCAGFNCVYI